MKNFPPYARGLFLVIAALSTTHAEAAEKNEQSAQIIGGLADGKETPVKVKKPAKARSADSRILNTIRKSQNGRMVTIHQVEAPEPLPIYRQKSKMLEATPEDSSVIRDAPALSPMRVIGISSSIYGTGTEKRTLVTLHYQGKNYWAWSNIDFRHLQGFTAYKANGREYFFLLGAGLARDDRGKVRGVTEAYKIGCPRRLVSTGNGANFSLIRGSAVAEKSEFTQAQEIFEDLHTLYRAEKDRLAAAHQSRLAMAPVNARRAGEKSGAPPKDITIRFWKRDVEGEQQARLQKAAQEGESK